MRGCDPGARSPGGSARNGQGIDRRGPMKTFLKIFITLLVVAGAFTAYVVFQPVRAVQQSANRPAVPPVQRNAGGMIIGEGHNAWVRQFDDEGRLASRFRAEKWEPQKNGLVRVIRPEAELLLKGGKDRDGKEKPRPLVRIRGDDGEVVVQSLPDAAATDKPLASSQGGSPNTPAGKGGSVGPAQPPSSGRLNGVVIDVFETEDARAARDAADEQHRLRQRHLPDLHRELPRRRRLDRAAGPGQGVGDGPRLRVLRARAHRPVERPGRAPRPAPHRPRRPPGDQERRSVFVRRPAAGRSRRRRPPRRPRRPAHRCWTLLASADPGAALALASADRRAKGAAAAAAAPASRPVRRKPKTAGGKDDQPPYRAAFHDDVRVVQGEQQLAMARLMNIDFLPGERMHGRAGHEAGFDAAKRKRTAKAPARSRRNRPLRRRTLRRRNRLDGGATSQPASRDASDGTVRAARHGVLDGRTDRNAVADRRCNVAGDRADDAALDGRPGRSAPAAGRGAGRAGRCAGPAHPRPTGHSDRPLRVPHGRAAGDGRGGGLPPRADHAEAPPTGKAPPPPSAPRASRTRAASASRCFGATAGSWRPIRQRGPEPPPRPRPVPR